MDIILSPRQAEIARLVAEDLTDQQIADRLRIASETVTMTLIEIRRRLGVRSRVGVAVAAVSRDLPVRDRRGEGQKGRTRGHYHKGGAR